MPSATILLDTNIVSYLVKRDTRGDLYRRHLIGQTKAISFMTVAELYRWVVKYKWQSSRFAGLESHLNTYLTLQSDEQTAWNWAQLMLIPGRPIEPGDAWIAATAMRHNIPLVTHNRSHFDHIAGLDLISEA